MKKVLLIAFDFPPHRSSGVYRPAAFTKYLLRQGWQTTVLTVAGAPGVEDASLLRKIPPEVRIVRTFHWQLRRWESKAAGLIRTLTSRALSASPVAIETPKREAARPASRSFLRKLADSVQNSLYFPDESAGWIPFALERALDLHFQERFDAVYTTHPPRAAHVMGMLLKVLCGVPWVAEFRDPWIIPPGSEPIADVVIPAAARNRWLLRRMLQFADAIVAVTPGYGEELVSLWNAPAARVQVINNGFDDEDFPGLGANNGRPAWMQPDCVHLAHFGTIYPEFHGSFFPALAEAARESEEVRRRLRVHLIGFPSDEVRAYARHDDLKEVLQFHPFLGHAEALGTMRASDCLLVFYGHRYTSQSSIPGKIYEYLRAGRPVLALAYAGGLRDLVEQSKAGCVLAPDDRQAIKRKLTSLAGRTLDSHQPYAPEFVAQYRYDNLAQKLAATLERVTKEA